jgi:cation diffusion facilitator CzcD-associated flavoprotein CzcO
MNELDKIGILDVLVIGTGFSGVCAGIELLQRGIHNFRIYDKTDGIGRSRLRRTFALLLLFV